MKHGGGKISVYGCFSSSAVDSLVKIEGNMDVLVFKSILERFMFPYTKRKMPRDCHHQMDNDSKHRSKLIINGFQVNHVSFSQLVSFQISIFLNI